MGSGKIKNNSEANLSNLVCQKITISRDLQEKVLTEILNNEIINSKGCNKLIPCRGCKLSDLKITP
jgi:hypothetical protein